MQCLRLRDRSLAVAGFFSDIQKLRKLSVAFRRKKIINHYLRSHKVRKLQIGAGKAAISGWLATDINPTSKEVVYLDATKKFPFPDRTFDYICCEHMIEHISWEEGLLMLRECRRILKDGGVIRIATPDLAVLLKMYTKDKNTKMEQSYIKWITDTFVTGVNLYRPSFVVNVAFRSWGHTFLYDGELLQIAMSEAGFANVRRVSVGESTHVALKGIERHGNVIENEDLNSFETMAFEATCQLESGSHRENPDAAQLVAAA